MLISMILFGISLASADSHEGWNGFVESSVEGAEETPPGPGEKIQDISDQINEKGEYYIKPGSKYTLNFYIALIIGGIAFSIILYLIYVMVRSPKKQFKN